MKKHTLAWLLAAGMAGLLLAACGGGDPDYGKPGEDTSFVPGEGIAPPRFAYVVHSNDDSVSGYNVDPMSGELTSMGAGTPWATGSTPTSIAVDPLVKYAYVANSGANNLSIFSISDPSGVLTSAALQPQPTGIQPKAVVIDPQGRYVYVANAGDDTISAYSRSTVTGLLTPITGSPFALPSSSDVAPWSVAVDPSGKFVYVANRGASSSPSTITMFTIDTASTGSSVPGALTAVGSIAAGARPNQITVSPSGKQVYVSNETGDSVMVYDIANATTGSLAYKGFVSAPGSTPTGVTIDPNNKYAYIANRSTGTIAAYTVASGGVSRGLLTAISGGSATITTPASPGPTSVAADPSGKFVYASLLNGGGIAAYKITTGTGALTMITGSPFDDGLAGTSDFIVITK